VCARCRCEEEEEVVEEEEVAAVAVAAAAEEEVFQLSGQGGRLGAQECVC